MCLHRTFTEYLFLFYLNMFSLFLKDNQSLHFSYAKYERKWSPFLSRVATVFHHKIKQFKRPYIIKGKHLAIQG